MGFEVPKYDAAKLSTSTLILAVKLQGLGDQPAVGMFTIGNVKVIPNVSGSYRRGSPIGVTCKSTMPGSIKPRCGLRWTLNMP